MTQYRTCLLLLLLGLLHYRQLALCQLLDATDQLNGQIEGLQEELRELEELLEVKVRKLLDLRLDIAKNMTEQAPAATLRALAQLASSVESAKFATQRVALQNSLDLLESGELSESKRYHWELARLPTTCLADLYKARIQLRAHGDASAFIEATERQIYYLAKRRINETSPQPLDDLLVDAFGLRRSWLARGLELWQDQQALVSVCLADAGEAPTRAKWLLGLVDELIDQQMGCENCRASSRPSQLFDVGKIFEDFQVTEALTRDEIGPELAARLELTDPEVVAILEATKGQPITGKQVADYADFVLKEYGAY